MNKKIQEQKVTLRLEKGNELIEKVITMDEICSLFDLQFMLDEVWDVLRLNNIDSHIASFFRKLNDVNEVIQGDVLYKYNSNSELEEIKKEDVFKNVQKEK